MEIVSVFAERCTGSTYLQELMILNFDIRLQEIGWKHGYPFHTFEDSDKVCTTHKRIAKYDLEKVLFIGIVRNPIDWINSFSQDLPNIPFENRSLHDFLRNEFYSVVDPENDTTVIQEDCNYLTGKRYKDIFELRRIKHKYLMEEFPKHVKHYELIRYEDLKSDFSKVLSTFETKYGLVRLHTEFQNVTYWKQYKHIPFEVKPIILPKEVMDEIVQKVDLEQEHKFGYLLEEGVERMAPN